MSFDHWKEKEIHIESNGVKLDGTLVLPDGAEGIVLFAHGSGSSRFSPRNRFVAGILNHAGVGTLLFDLLTGEEEAEDSITGNLRFDIPFLKSRLVDATDWVTQQPEMEHLRIGYFGSSTGGAAALAASVDRIEQIRAIVCRGSRTDLAAKVIRQVQAPALLVVGERDEQVLEWNRESFIQLRSVKHLEIIPRATHLFEEHGALEQVARCAAKWFQKWLICSEQAGPG